MNASAFIAASIAALQPALADAIVAGGSSQHLMQAEHLAFKLSGVVR
jgi:hypothetical protein